MRACKGPRLFSNERRTRRIIYRIPVDVPTNCIGEHAACCKPCCNGKMNSRFADLVDHDPRNAGCSSCRRFSVRSLTRVGVVLGRVPGTRGRLTRPYRLTSASDLTRNSLSFPGSSLLHFYFRIFPPLHHGTLRKNRARRLEYAFPRSSANCNFRREIRKTFFKLKFLEEVRRSF